MNHKILTIALGASLIAGTPALAATTAPAAHPAPAAHTAHPAHPATAHPKPMMSMTGKVMSADDKMIVIKHGTKTETMMVSSTTTYTMGGKAAEASAVTVGSTVKISCQEGMMNGAKSMNAMKIEVVPAKPATPAKPAHPAKPAAPAKPQANH